MWFRKSLKDFNPRDRYNSKDMILFNPKNRKSLTDFNQNFEYIFVQVLPIEKKGKNLSEFLDIKLIGEQPLSRLLISEF